jgi:hypothetical protein
MHTVTSAGVVILSVSRSASLWGHWDGPHGYLLLLTHARAVAGGTALRRHQVYTASRGRDPPIGGPGVAQRVDRVRDRTWSSPSACARPPCTPSSSSAMVIDSTCSLVWIPFGLVYQIPVRLAVLAGAPVPVLE